MSSAIIDLVLCCLFCNIIFYSDCKRKKKVDISKNIKEIGLLHCSAVTMRTGWRSCKGHACYTIHKLQNLTILRLRCILFCLFGDTIFLICVNNVCWLILQGQLPHKHLAQHMRRLLYNKLCNLIQGFILSIYLISLIFLVAVLDDIFNWP